MRRHLSVLLTFSDFTTAIRSMMSLNSSLYLAARAIFTFQLLILNKFLSLFRGYRWTRLDVGGGAEKSKTESFNTYGKSKQRGADELMELSR